MVDWLYATALVVIVLILCTLVLSWRLPKPKHWVELDERRQKPISVPEVTEVVYEDEVEEKPSGLMTDSPLTFDGFVGQPIATELLSIHVKAAKRRGKVVPHVMLEGPGGTGKTTLAFCMSNEMGSKTYVTTPSTFKDKDSVLNFFIGKDGKPKINRGDLVFIDEIHRLREAAAIYIYSAMQDFYIDTGEGIVSLPEFTVVGATTDLGMLAGPFRDRFKVRISLNRYSAGELSHIVMAFKNLGEDLATEIAQRSCGIPRIAKSIADSVIAVAASEGDESPNISHLRRACDLLEIDDSGLTKQARSVVRFFQENNNTPMGVASLAGTLGISRDTVEHEIYPVLLTKGLLMSRGTRGKCLSVAGEKYNLSTSLIGEIDA